MNGRFFLSVNAVLLCTFTQGALPTLEDEQYKTACGPIACLVALRSVGVEATLDEIVKRSGWEQDKVLPLESLQRVLQSYRGIDCQIAHLSPAELCTLLKDDQTVVILAIRKETDAIDHAVCAVGVQEHEQVIHLIDYPELRQKKLIGEIAESWDGASLVVRSTALNRALCRFALWFAPMIVVIVGMLWFRSRKGGKGSE